MTQNDLKEYLLQIKTSSFYQTQFCRWTIFTCYGLFFSIFFFLSYATFCFEKSIRNLSQASTVILLFLVFQILGSLIWGVTLDFYGRLWTLTRLCGLLCITMGFVFCLAYMYHDTISLSLDNHSLVTSHETNSTWLRLTPISTTDVKPNNSIVSLYALNTTLHPISTINKTTLVHENFNNNSAFLYKEDQFILLSYLSIFNTLLDKIIIKNQIIPYVWYWYYFILVPLAGLTLGGVSVVTPVIVSESMEKFDQLVYLGVLFCMKLFAQLFFKLTISSIRLIAYTNVLPILLYYPCALNFIFSLILSLICLFLTKPIPTVSTPSLCETNSSTTCNLEETLRKNCFPKNCLQTVLPYFFFKKQKSLQNMHCDSIHQLHTDTMLISNHNAVEDTNESKMKCYFFYLLGYGLPWFILCFSFFDDGFFDNFFIYSGASHTNKLQKTFEFSVVCFSLLGTIVSIWCLNQLLPKLFQMLGFAIMGFVYFGLALALFSVKHPLDITNMGEPIQKISTYYGASLLYQCVFRSATLIPCLTCFLLPLNACPKKNRGFYYSSVYTCSRLGAICGLLFFNELIRLQKPKALVLAIYCLTGPTGLVFTRAFTKNINSLFLAVPV